MTPLRPSNHKLALALLVCTGVLGSAPAQPCTSPASGAECQNCAGRAARGFSAGVVSFCADCCGVVGDRVANGSKDWVQQLSCIRFPETTVVMHDATSAGYS